MTDPRQKLPPRRPALTQPVAWERDARVHRFTLTLGFCPSSGRVREVFADAAGGSDMAHVIADGCILASLLLQHGADPRAVAVSLLKIPQPALGRDACAPASVLGAIMEAVVTVEGGSDG
jgi:hypothetical protein